MEKQNKKKRNQSPKQLANIKKISRIQTGEEAERKIQEYFKRKKREKRMPTVIGIANALGLYSRQALINYENEEKNKDLPKEEKLLIVDAIKKAKAKIEEMLEENLVEGKQVAGTIFNLKNNYGYSDKTELEHKGKLQIIIEGIEKF